MNITIENKKQKALELMKKLDIYKPYIHKSSRIAFLRSLAVISDFTSFAFLGVILKLKPEGFFPV